VLASGTSIKISADGGIIAYTIKHEEDLRSLLRLALNELIGCFQAKVPLWMFYAVRARIRRL